MIEQKQKYRHKPEEGEIGDCFRTCIACVLDLNRDEVPHVFYDNWKDGEVVTVEAHKQLNDYLAEYDLVFAETPLQATREQLNTYLAHYYKDMYVVVGCNSKNGGHSVVMCNGDYMWDPSIDNSGCVGPMEDGYYWIGLILKDTR